MRNILHNEHPAQGAPYSISCTPFVDATASEQRSRALATWCRDSTTLSRCGCAAGIICLVQPRVLSFIWMTYHHAGWTGVTRYVLGLTVRGGAATRSRLPRMQRAVAQWEVTYFRAVLLGGQLEKLAGLLLEGQTVPPQLGRCRRLLRLPPCLLVVLCPGGRHCCGQGPSRPRLGSWLCRRASQAWTSPSRTCE